MSPFRVGAKLMLASMVALLLGATSPEQDLSILSLAAGDCRDLDLRASAKAFTESMRGRAPALVVDSAGLTLRSTPSTSAEELRRQIDVAQDHFYNAQYVKSERLLDPLFPEIERLPPGEVRWSLRVAAQLLRALLLRGTNKAAQADPVFQELLALDPGHQLNEYFFAPSTRSAFEVSRAAMLAAPKARLSVRTPEPGAEVYLEGKRVGTTPFEGDYPPGRYSLELTKGSQRSFLHRVELREALSLLIDLPLEGAVVEGDGLCLSGHDGPEATLSDAAKLGSSLKADRVVVVRSNALAGSSRWLVATLVASASGQRIREGALKTTKDSPTAQAFDELARYVMTGQANEGVVTLAGQGSIPWGAHPVAEDSPSARRMRLQRRLAFAALSLGGASLAAAGVLRLASQPDLDRLGGRLQDGFVSEGDAGAIATYTSLQSRAAATTALLVAGAVVAGAGGALLLTTQYTERLTMGVTAVPSPGGTTVQVSGRF